MTTAHRLTGRTIVITGAGRGLGLAMARSCLDEGATVVAVDRDGDRLDRAVAELRQTGPVELSAEVCDITDESQVSALFAGMHEPPWGIVNNAALADGVGGLPFWEIEQQDWRRVLGVNLDGTWLFTKYGVRPMLARGEGRIVNLASDAALYGSPRLSHYIASKGGIIALTRAMARDLGPHGITVNAVAPGLTEGPSAETIPAERHRLYADGRAIDRAQVPDDVTGIVSFLLGDRAAYITGQTIVVDGGFVMA